MEMVTLPQSLSALSFSEHLFRHMLQAVLQNQQIQSFQCRASPSVRLVRVAATEVSSKLRIQLRLHNHCSQRIQSTNG